MGTIFSFIVDIVIIGFLVAAIFYVARLSVFLKTFRQERQSMLELIRDLSQTISQAELSIDKMKQETDIASLDLKSKIDDAQSTRDELDYINATSNRLAERLETLIHRNKELIELVEESGGLGLSQDNKTNVTLPKSPRNDSDPSFSIQDFELDADLDKDDENDFHALDDGVYTEPTPQKKKSGFSIFDREFLFGNDAKKQQFSDEITAGNHQEPQEKSKRFSSQAEQDLYEALKKNKKDQEVYY